MARPTAFIPSGTFFRSPLRDSAFTPFVSNIQPLSVLLARSVHVSPTRPAPCLSAASPRRAQLSLSASVSASSPTLVPLSLGPLRFSVPGRWLLCLVPLLWASFIACAKLLYLLPRAISPAAFNASRLLVSSLFFLPTLVTELRRLSKNRVSRGRPGALRFFTAGLELGGLMFVANLAQIAGLKYTDASRAAFLNQLSTVFVPLATAAFGLEALSARVTVGAACALAGVALLTLAGSATTGATAAAAAGVLPGLGDGLEMLAAVFTTFYVLRVSRHARATRGKSGPLVAMKVVTQAVLSLMWLGGGRLLRGGAATAAAAVSAAPVVPWTPLAVGMNIMLVLWAGAVVSAATSWMQTKGQEAVPASEAAILYAAQPLWASVIATLLLGETLGINGMFGAGMIVAGTIVSSTGGKHEAR